MAGRVYVEKPEQVQAEQFVAAQTPWPPGVVPSPDGPVVQWPSGIQTPIHDTDWITVNVRSGQQQVLSDAAFQDRYGGGPADSTALADD